MSMSDGLTTGHNLDQVFLRRLDAHALTAFAPS